AFFEPNTKTVSHLASPFLAFGCTIDPTRRGAFTLPACRQQARPGRCDRVSAPQEGRRAVRPASAADRSDAARDWHGAQPGAAAAAARLGKRGVHDRAGGEARGP